MTFAAFAETLITLSSSGSDIIPVSGSTDARLEPDFGVRIDLDRDGVGPPNSEKPELLVLFDRDGVFIALSDSEDFERPSVSLSEALRADFDRTNPGVLGFDFVGDGSSLDFFLASGFGAAPQKPQDEAPWLRTTFARSFRGDGASVVVSASGGGVGSFVRSSTAVVFPDLREVAGTTGGGGTFTGVSAFADLVAFLVVFADLLSAFPAIAKGS